MSETTTNRRLRCRLTHEEKEARGQLLAEHLADYRRVEDEKKRQVSAFNERLKEIRSFMDEAGDAVRHGQEFRDVECLWIPIHRAGVDILVRQDTKAIIQKRKRPAQTSITDPEAQEAADERLEELGVVIDFPQLDRIPESHALDEAIDEEAGTAHPPEPLPVVEVEDDEEDAHGADVREAEEEDASIEDTDVEATEPMACYVCNHPLAEEEHFPESGAFICDRPKCPGGLHYACGCRSELNEETKGGSDYVYCEQHSGGPLGGWGGWSENDEDEVEESSHD